MTPADRRGQAAAAADQPGRGGRALRSGLRRARPAGADAPRSASGGAVSGSRPHGNGPTCSAPRPCAAAWPHQRRDHRSSCRPRAPAAEPVPVATALPPEATAAVPGDTPARRTVRRPGPVLRGGPAGAAGARPGHRLAHRRRDRGRRRRGRPARRAARAGPRGRQRGRHRGAGGRRGRPGRGPRRPAVPAGGPRRPHRPDQRPGAALPQGDRQGRAAHGRAGGRPGQAHRGGAVRHREADQRPGDVGGVPPRPGGRRVGTARSPSASSWRPTCAWW